MPPLYGGFFVHQYARCKFVRKTIDHVYQGKSFGD